MTVDLQNLIARACFGRPGPTSPTTAELEAAGLPPKRIAIYRRLLRHNVSGVIETMLANTKARLDARVPGAMETTIDAFLDEVGPKTPHLRDVPRELLAFAAPRWRDDERLPRWIADHAELELLDFTIGVAPRPPTPPKLAEVSADRPLVFAEPRALVRLGWAVNAMGEVAADAADPAERPVVILVYRDAAHCSRFLELTPLAAAILERLFAGEALGPAMTAACAAADAPLTQELLEGTSRLLADLGERGVLLGARDA